jgi:hypothetical protein
MIINSGNADNNKYSTLYKISQLGKMEKSEDKSDNVINDEDKMFQRKMTNTNASELSEVNSKEFFFNFPIIYLFF